MIGHNALPLVFFSGTGYSQNTGSVTGTGNCVGGVAGWNRGAINPTGSSSAVVEDRPWNTGVVTGQDAVGGIIGKNIGSVSGQKGAILWNNGAVTGHTNVGGLVGESTGPVKGMAEMSLLNTGSVTGQNNVGGAVGRMSDEISFARNNGTVAAANIGGGLVGILAAGGSIINSYSTARVCAEDAGTAPVLGGLVGELSSDAAIRRSYCYCDGMSLLLVGTGTGITDSAYYRWTDAEPGNDLGIPASDAEFASGKVAYLLDGGQLSRSKVWSQENGLPVLASGHPVWHLKLIRDGELPEGCAVSVVSTDAYTVFPIAEGNYELYAVDETDILLQAELANSYRLTLTPSPEVHAVEGGYTFPLMRDYNITYRVYQQDNANYAWYFDAPEGETTYVISNKEELLSFANLVNGTVLDEHGQLISPVDFQGKTVRLDADILWTGGNWIPAGTAEAPFKGNFDGSGYTISGLTCTGEGDVGFFGYLYGAAVKDLTLSGIVYNTGDTTGGLAAHAIDSRFTDCICSMTVTGEGMENGGMVGEGELLRFENCVFDGVLSGKGKYTGGLLGKGGAGCSMEKCCNQGSVSGEGDHVGGLAGSMGNYARFTSCENKGAVSGLDYTGGIVGETGDNAELIACVNSGALLSCGSVGGYNGTSDIGGLAGRMGSSATVMDCVNTGSITVNGSMVGGIVGRITGATAVSGCRNTGSILCYPNNQANDGGNIGGIVGNLGFTDAGMLVNCLNEGDISGGRYMVGGIAGSAAPGDRLSKCINRGNIAVSNEEGRYGWRTGGILGYAGNKGADPRCCVNLGKVILNGIPAEPVLGGGLSEFTGCFTLTGNADTDRYAENRNSADFLNGKVAYELDTLDHDLRTYDWSFDEDGICFADETHAPVFALICGESVGGTLICPAYAHYADYIAVIARPQEGKSLALLTVTDEAGTEIYSTGGEGEHAFTMPLSDVYVSAEWIEKKMNNTP